MDLRNISQENGWERLPAYIFISIMIHLALLILIPYPLAERIKRPIEVKLIRETRIEEIRKVVPQRRVNAKRVVVAVQSILKESLENIPLAPKVPPPMSLPKARSLERRSIEILEEKLKSISAEGGAPLEFTPSASFIDPNSIPLIIPKGISLQEKKPGKKEKPLRKGILQFTGPITQRKLVYMPPPPKVSVKIDTKVHIKFWVEPDGSVFKVELKRVMGDPLLGPVAVNYVKALRFNPVVGGGRVWGEVDVLFKRVR